ncbi:hypothetical protein EJ08DRAFT_485684 [Tothia fuscella]|uniref:Uncharacterized protein n=1 Tax=Tothia fuscella TaxID=1048955 RepID=A0A9P4TUJ6_9PEZI|nr:hypothetical protein EJ08DRAFT_485684 [Tothia fuscella]
MKKKMEPKRKDFGDGFASWGSRGCRLNNSRGRVRVMWVVRAYVTSPCTFKDVVPLLRPELVERGLI